MLAKICLTLILTPVFLHISVSFAQCLFMNIANNQLTSVDMALNTVISNFLPVSNNG